MVTKADFVDLLAEKTGYTKKEGGIIVNAVIDIITEKLAAGEAIKFPGFGSFEVKETAEHMGINPRTKEPIKIEKTAKATFKAGETLKKALNSKEKE